MTLMIEIGAFVIPSIGPTLMPEPPTVFDSPFFAKSATSLKNRVSVWNYIVKAA
jgi:hypothetical protein